MRVRVVVSPETASWIIGKMSARLVEELNVSGVEATLAHEPQDDADVNHWMSYASVLRRSGRVSTMFITHVDDPYKTSHVGRTLRDHVDLGLCMSRDMMRALTEWGIPADRLWYVLPAFDAPPDPARISIAVTTRLYPDGRKREALLERLAAEHDLSPFHFEIMGSRWDLVVPKLRAAGASVNWGAGGADYQADYSAMREAMRRCEYYLYLGMDEGSLGTLDALALGLKTIVTPQGFHLDIRNGITEAVETYEDVVAAFERISAERSARIASVRTWTWAQYAREHLLVWRALLEGRRADVPHIAQGEGRYAEVTEPLQHPGLGRRTWSGYFGRSLSPSRLMDAITRLPIVQPLRRMLRR